MNLVASMIVRNEMGRYLEPCIRHLQDFCDEIRVVDDASDDGTFEWLAVQEQVVVTGDMKPRFYVHEGQARQRLLDWTLEAKPTHILVIDADEFVVGSDVLRANLIAHPDTPIWALKIEEIWRADMQNLHVREDGGWRTHPLPCVFNAQPGIRLEMMNRKLAVRRIPTHFQQLRAQESGASLLHFGWTDPANRRARYDRYHEHDRGRFHSGHHLRSILWDDRRVVLRRRLWPGEPVFEQLRERFV